MEKNKIKQPLKIITLTIVFSLLLSLLPNNLSILGIKLKHVDILSDLKVTSNQANTEEKTDTEYQNYLKEYEQMLKQGKDTTSEETNKKESMLNFKNNVLTAGFFNFGSFFNSPKYGHRGPQTKLQKIVGNTSEMQKFYSALKRSNTSIVRIAHFGDSGIEGDLISADIREELQKKYGGKGVGWLSMRREDITFRISTKQSFSDNWQMYSIYTNNPKGYSFGISGEIFIPKGTCWSQFEATRFYPHSSPYKLARIFYSNAKNGSIEYQFGNRTHGTIRLKRGADIQEAVVKSKRPVKKFRITIPAGTDSYFYGVSLENGNGVYLDNFPLRGNSGVDINEIPIKTLKNFRKYLNYKLIILEFGLNALPIIKRNYNWYVREMVSVIKHLKQAFPDAAILMIGAQDKSIRRGGKFITDPTIFKLLKAQLEIVKKTNVAYWNLFEAMGGVNSMHKWVTNNPPLASQDHIHFNLQGGKKVAQLFVESLLESK
jgi:hypothetical protein